MQHRKQDVRTVAEEQKSLRKDPQGRNTDGKLVAGPWKRWLIPVAYVAIAAAASALVYFFLILPGALPWTGSGKEEPGPPFTYSFTTKMAQGFDVSVIPDEYSTYEAPPWGDDDVFSLLVIGRDKDYSKTGALLAKSHGRADTIMMLLLPRARRTATLVSIPRDTLVIAKDKGMVAKINSLYDAIPPSSLMDAVAELTGVKIDRWACLDFEGFADIVDLLGGVDVEVTKRMKYTDKAAGYSIDLDPGTYHFDGAQALSYIRYRNDALGDIGRVDRQLELVKKLAAKAMSWNTAGRLFGLVSVAGRSIMGDLDLEEAFAVGVRLLRVGSSNIETWKVPGGFVGPYWQADLPRLREMVSEAML